MTSGSTFQFNEGEIWKQRRTQTEEVDKDRVEQDNKEIDIKKRERHKEEKNYRRKKRIKVAILNGMNQEEVVRKYTHLSYFNCCYCSVA